MRKHSPISAVVITTVTQPPWSNFSTTSSVRIERHIIKPTLCSERLNFHFGSVRRWLTESRHMPISESEKVMNTLIEYIVTSVSIRPRVRMRIPMEASAMRITP